jgi:hypothetical protein
MKRIIGIDPGKTGAIAIIEKGEVTVQVLPLELSTGEAVTYYEAQKRDKKLPKTRKHFVKDARLSGIVLAQLMKDSVVYMERQQVRSRQKGGLAIGMNYGIIIGACRAIGINPVIIQPKEWQHWVKYELGTKEEIDTKELARLYCKEKGMTILKSKDGMSDAICIAYYGEYYEDKHSLHKQGDTIILA